MNLTLLYRERALVNHQFPTVRALDEPPRAYVGLLRCEGGEVKRLGDEGVWPFTEYAAWNRFHVEMPTDYPLRPPSVTWLSDVSHPNIVPNVPGAVCVSILGGAWRPSLSLVSVINSLYYVLADPNPNSAFDHPRCLRAAEVCRKHGFPKMVEPDMVSFKVVRKGRQPRGDLVRFRLKAGRRVG